ncbi:MAG: aminopeptidase P family N-terminal domain-containing protein, partial [Pseudomonadota bacterium]|nr:aminopeptidase P family N-terminal domain-containing protein [Pseudomonadota bacterium]
MTIGVGGSDPTAELQAMQSMRGDAHPISNTERETRIAKAQELMRQKGITALYLDASTSLSYYTGLRAEGKERLHGEVIPADGPLSYI